MPAYSDPAIMIKRAVAEHFEVLYAPCTFCFCIIKGIYHADSFDRFLPDTIYFNRFGYSCSFEHRGRYVNDVVKLSSQTTFVFNFCRPGNNERVTRATKMRSNLFAPLERCVHCPGPSDVEMVVCLRTTQLIQMFKYIIRTFLLTIQGYHLIEHAT